MRGLVPGEEVLVNDRTQIAPYELDLLLPSRHIAVEVNEDGWHGPMLADPHSYHARKVELAEKAGISLVFVWESQWRQDRAQIEADVRSFVKSSGTVIKVTTDTRS